MFQCGSRNIAKNSMDFCAKFYPLSVIVCTRIKKVHKGYVCCYLNKPLNCSSELSSVFFPMIIFPEATIKVYTCCFRGVSNDTPDTPLRTGLLCIYLPVCVCVWSVALYHTTLLAKKLCDSSFLCQSLDLIHSHFKTDMVMYFIF